MVERSSGGLTQVYQFIKSEQGTAALEYVLFVSLIGMVVAGALLAVGGSLVEALSSINLHFNTVLLNEDTRNQTK